MTKEEWVRKHYMFGSYVYVSSLKLGRMLANHGIVEISGLEEGKGLRDVKILIERGSQAATDFINLEVESEPVQSVLQAAEP